MIGTTLRRGGAFAAALVFASPLSLVAQTAAGQGWNPQQVLRTETYVKPPADIEKVIMTPRTDISFTTPSPDRKWFVRLPGADRGDIDEYGKYHIYLGGVQIDTKANRVRALTTSTHHGIALVDPRTSVTKTIETPKGASISSPSWSPNGTQLAYIANFDDASQIYVADVSTGKSTQVTKTPILGTLVTTVEWTADGKSVVTVILPDARGPAPTHGKNNVEDGPQVRISEGRANPQIIYPSLLEDPHDKAQLTYYTTGQLAVIDVKSKAVKKIGAPAMIRSVEASEDGKYFRVTELAEPFSYIVPVANFGSVQALWDATGKPVAMLAKTPLRDGENPDADAAARGGRGGGAGAPTDTGKRNIQWNPTGAGLVYLQSMFAGTSDAGPAGAGRVGRGRAGGASGAALGRPQPTSIRYMSWAPPFGPGDAKLIYEGSPRLTGVAYSADGKTMFVADSGTVLAMHTADPSKKFNLGRGVTMPAGGGGFGGAGGGRGGAGATDETGGALAMKRLANGEQAVVVASDGRTVYLSGTRTPGAKWETQAPRPWVDKLDFETGQRSRIFDSPADAFDEFVTPLDDDYSKFIYTHESPSIIQDAFMRDTKAGTSTQLTHAVDASPAVSHAQYKRLQITRPRDGFKFWVDVTLPADWRPGTRLPGIIWFYPREYTTQADYDRTRYTTNINKFPDVAPARPASSVKLWATQGYALIEPDSPIVGDSGKMNDHYTRDLRENLDVVIDAVVDAGYVDRNKMGLGGHSYGAFSTVNALTLVPYFKAGIAGDGMYNRSLTPFGFQTERRNFFDAQATYVDMSPFFRADKIHGALLMYHALEDQNNGTDPISSERMYLALRGLGKPVALYMYPYEDHSDATYASDLDIWARWLAWFDVYVKNPQQVTP
ncbi:MAG: prolyl oligopeptidase family serine peptidase [Gemmatimonadaceae bacterium]